MRIRAAGVAIGCVALGSSVARGQCKPPLNSNEAKLLAFYEAPVVFAPADAPATLAPWHVGLVGELTYVPTAPSSITTTGFCFESKQQDTHLSPILPRIRVSLGLPMGFSIEGSYLPPITVASATPNFGSLAVAYTHELSPFVVLQGRIHGTVGTVKGPITCSKSALQQSDPTQPCYGTQPSDDTFKPNSIGADVAAGFTPNGGRFTVYGGVGYAYLPARFQVDFTDLNGFTDRTPVEVGMSRESIFGGLDVRIIEGLSAGAQVYSVPADLTTFRVSVGYRL